MFVNQLSNFLTDEEFNQILSYIDRITRDNDFPGWKLTSVSDFSKNRRFWNFNLSKEKLFTEYFFNIFSKKIYEMFEEKITLSRVYLNGMTYGQHGTIHPDEFYSEKRTLLIYCNETWKNDWGGGTIFDYGETTKIVMPKPKTAVYFDSTIFHGAQTVTPDFTDLRVSLAYKLGVETDDQ